MPSIYPLPFLLLAVLLLAGESSSQPASGDQATLLAIKKGWGDPAQLASWDPAAHADHCSWTGVACEGAGAGRVVTGLSLQKLNISGEVPGSVCDLANLARLDLSYNNLTGAFPGAALYRCARLRSLDLSYNGFDGALPDDIGLLSSAMEHLNLSANHFSGAVPAAVAGLPLLKSLILDTNQFTGAYPAAEISKLTGLEKLTLAVNPFAPAPAPSEFAKLTNLSYLWMADMNMTGEIPKAYSSLVKLEMLSVTGNNLTGGIPAWVLQLPKLKYVYLFNNGLTGELPRNITAVNLMELDVSSNNLTGEIPEDIGNLKNLSILFMYTNQLTGTIPASMATLPKLSDIRLFENKLSGELPAELGKHSPLVNLEFPAKIWSFPKLTTLMIHNNGFTGALPAVLSENITRIEMGNNKFSGSFPTSATGLSVFQAENNQLSGDLPVNMSKFADLTDLSVSGNQLTGSIPASVNLLQKLNSLNLSGNRLSGTIPPSSIGLLPSLNILDLSGNEITGAIPPDFNNLKLNKLDMSSNQLTGEVLPSLQSAAYESSFVGNHGLCARKGSGVDLPKCGSARDELSRGLIVLFSMLAGIVLVGSVGIACLLFRRRKEQQEVTDWKMTQFTHLGFTESDVLNNIREENVIGSGGSGKVYRIHLPARAGGDEEHGGSGGGRMVAVKRIWNARKLEAKFDKEFEAEVKPLHHLDRQGAPAPLDWPTRLAIAIDSAKGLSYMHHDSAQSIVHRDVKSSNILLDPEFHAKIADFGLARMLVKSGELESVSAIGGTFGYMAPEYASRLRVNEKVDVYSFGVVLLELITGKVANDGGADVCLAEWAWRRYQKGPPFNDVVDEHIRDPANMADILAVFTLGVICTGENPPARPSMKEVLQHLIRCDRMSAQAEACQLDYGGDGGAPLLEAKKGSRRRDVSDSGRWDDDEEDSGNFVVHAV
ncbi:Receptor-like protein kinase HSL1 [Triticum urartu]|uniref:non-specific serine/threonine protein kinase n=1 Tax=Triticum urartu TaxID=4572 RepID=M8ASJ2_TRIUA|nr:Receptor-like protein kinase HSL1 [Triticum urartu]